MKAVHCVLSVLIFLSGGLICEASLFHLILFPYSDSMGLSFLRARELSFTPPDRDVCKGQRINLTCSLLVPHLPNASFSFETIQSGRWAPVTENDVIFVNETMAKLTYDVTAQIVYEYIRCSYGNEISALRPTLTTLSVYPPPEKVQNFACIVRNFVESMTCTWDYGVSYSAMPKVDCQWKHPRWGVWMECPHLDATRGRCSWNSIRNGDFSFTELKFEMSLVQKCGLSATSTFRLDTSMLVKPDPVDSLSAQVLSSVCIKLSWKTISSRPEYGRQHFVSWSNKWGDKMMDEFTTSSGIQTVDKTYCDLRPFTKYTFSVYMMPEVGGFSSDVKSVEAITQADKPSAAPEVVPGAYMWHESDCDRDSQRTVCLLWKPVREEDRNGWLTSYDVTFVPTTSTEGNQSVISMEADAAMAYVCSPPLLCDANYSAIIKTVNEIGASEEQSYLYIASAESEIFQPEFTVEMGNMTDGPRDVHVSWSYIPGKQASTITIFWSQTQNGDCKDSGIIDWHTVESNASEAVLRITSPEDYLYGVSLTSLHGSSGFAWRSCIYTKHAEPNMEPQNVMVLPGDMDNTLLVIWDKLHCEMGEPIISSYIVQYCIDGNCEEMRQSANGAGFTIIRSIDDRKTYTISVRAVSKDGLEGPKSQTVQNAASRRSQ